ncbi:LysR substrate-binding domain-containing protein [Jannaschia sp. S6380]|uniref:LysR substrate-binding domain-containing protein n=1 Tax=Jannaschia sp. S6380 TaxID=2926408 RepID=UPI001FF2C862|nr:LysR substrate-binding domain-containing protein [Jannaschia sp. S6380]MCK0168595.1 LysR substrate-binding domain-containing protein [Jannaschia sp. S6380]
MRELNLLPLSALRAVEAVGRLGGLRAAAGEMGVSEGAVSQAIIKAEARLGRTLFERRPKGMRPTDAGAEVCRALTRGMAELSRAIRLAHQNDAGLVTISVAPVFASRWLVPRLGRLRDVHPDIRLRIDASFDLVDPWTADVDLCLRAGTGEWPGLDCTRLCDQPVFPVCAPALAGTLRIPADLKSVSILHDDGDPEGWRIWRDAHGLEEAAVEGGTVFSNAGLCLDAAITGQGVYLAWKALACDALASGSLVQPFPDAVATGRAYWLVWPRQARLKAAARKVAEWMVAEMVR